MKHLSKLVVAVLGVVIVLPAAHAQESDDALLEEIKVTAQRREQSTMDVPISVLVFDSNTIEQNNMKGAADYLLMTPNVSFREDGRGGNRSINIAMRGISDLTSGERVTATQSFGFYWDEFSVATVARGTSNPPLYDVESIEVLRGPQGTYFGRNAEGGAINVVTKKPTQEFYGQVDLGYGSFNSYEVSGVLNLPIADNLAIRTVVNTETSDGAVDNTHPTGGNSGHDLTAVRSKLRWNITDVDMLDLGVSYSREEQGFAAQVATCIDPTFGFDPTDPAVLGGLACFDQNTDDTFQNTDSLSEDRTTILTANYTHDWDEFALTAIIGQVKTDFDQLFDLDHSGLDSVDRLNNYTTTSQSQEFRLASTGAQTIDWTVGALLYKDELTASNGILIKDFLGPWLRGDLANENQINIDRKGFALFADVGWHISDRTLLTIGGRYSDDEDKQFWREVYGACPRRAPGDPLATGCVLRPDQLLPLPIYTDGGGGQAISGGRSPQTAGTDVANSGTDFSPRVAINFDLNDSSMIYGIYSQGYKAAGARANPDSGGENNSIYDKEKLHNFEAGIKGTTSDGRLRYEVAVFHMLWEDFQATIRESFCRLPNGDLVPNDGTVPPADCTITPLDRIQNAPEASATGLELTATWIPVDDVTVGFVAGYLDSEFDDFKEVPIGGGVQDLSGETLPNAPEFTATLMSQYDWDIGNAGAYIRGEWNFRDSYSKGLSDPTDASRRLFPYTAESYDVLNLRAGLEWDRARLALTVNNVLGEDYTTGLDGFSYGGALVDVHPTTFNLRLTLVTD